MVRRGMKPQLMDSLTRQDTAWDSTPSASSGRLAGLNLATRLAAVLALLPALGFLLVLLAPPLNPDVSAVLDFATRMLRGEPLYERLVDVNPPLIFLLNLPAALLAEWTPLRPGQALQLSVLLLCAAVWRLCILLRHPAEGPAARAVLLAVLPLLMLQAGFDFAQREHLMAVAALPYLILAERRITGQPAPRRLWWATLLLAAAGFALKPHFLAVPALVEAAVLLSVAPRRGLAAALRDPLPWGLAVLWLLYLAAIPLFFPAYLDTVLPLIRDWYLDFGGGSVGQVLRSAITGSAALFTLGLAWLTLMAPRRLGWLPRLAAAAALGGLAAALVQHKGWSYHLVPVWLFGGLAGAMLLARAADALLPDAAAGRAGPLLAFAAALALACFALRGDQSPWVQLNYANSPGGQLATWLRREAPRGELLALSPDISGLYPAVQDTEQRLLLPYMSTWLLQATYATCHPAAPRYRPETAMPAAERRLRDEVAEALAFGMPETVVIARWSGIPDCGGSFDLLEYFSQDRRFATAFRHYRPAGEIAGYRLFRRRD